MATGWLLRVGWLSALAACQATAARFSVGADGYFRDRGAADARTRAPAGSGGGGGGGGGESGNALFVPVGVNYWPRSVGASLWFSAFPAEEIRADMAVLKASGFNAVRVFVTWPCFEPAPGVYNKTAFANLARMLGYVRDAGLAADLSVFVGGMSGRFYWPTWLRGNIYADEVAAAQSAAFALEVATAAAPFADAIFTLEVRAHHGNPSLGATRRNGVPTSTSCGGGSATSPKRVSAGVSACSN